MSFIMSYTINGTEIRVAHPLHSISVNKNQVVFADKQGFRNVTLPDAKQAKAFINWLIRIPD